MKLSTFDQHRPKAAEGWLEQGNRVEAVGEVEEITFETRVHQGLLELR